MASSDPGEREPVSVAHDAEHGAGDGVAAGFDAVLDAPLTESRLRAIERTNVLSAAQLSRAARLVGGPLPSAVWRVYLQRVLLLAAAAHLVAGVGLLLVELWEDLGQVGSIALTAVVTVAPALAARHVGLRTTVGRTLLTASALLCAVLVTVAQLAFPLPFSSWIVPGLVVVLALPFALASRSGITWLIPLGALHVSAVLLLEDAGDVDDSEIWLMTSGLGAAAWFGWSTLARGVSWMRGPLVPRIEGSVAVVAATVVALQFASGGWFDEIEPVPGTLATTTLVVAGGWLTYRVFTARGDPLLAAVAIAACAIVAAVGVARLMDDVLGLPTELAFATAGLGLVAATAVSIWLLRTAVRRRGET